MSDNLTVNLVNALATLDVTANAIENGISVQMLELINGVTVKDGDAIRISVGQGIDGREVEMRKTETALQWHYVGEATWNNLIDLSVLSAETIMQYDSAADFPVLGSSAKIYIDKATDRSYRWDSDSHHYYCIGADYSKVTVINGNII